MLVAELCPLASVNSLASNISDKTKSSNNHSSEKTAVKIFAKIFQLQSQTFAKAFRCVFLEEGYSR